MEGDRSFARAGWFAVVALLAIAGWVLVVGPTLDPCRSVRMEVRAMMIRAKGFSFLAAPFISDSFIDAAAAESGRPLTAPACLQADWELFTGRGLPPLPQAVP
jgi:hypothetical protein